MIVVPQGAFESVHFLVLSRTLSWKGGYNDLGGRVHLSEIT